LSRWNFAARAFLALKRRQTLDIFARARIARTSSRIARKRRHPHPDNARD